MRGSPPHAWGRHHGRDQARCRGRFTPTRVGKTTAARQPATGPAVHPHTRGEDASKVTFGIGASGSPPHAWGRHPHLLDTVPDHRFTPTRVGKTSPSRAASRSRTVHPHTRGEDAASRGRGRYPRGSPPHAWGRLLRILRLVLGLRFTPTRVGKTPHRPSGRRGRAVHPHTRGEDRRPGQLRDVSHGSPPHAWGRQVEAHPGVVHVRFTPTRVGKTSSRDPDSRWAAVHPHTRGEDVDLVPMVIYARGSPPHAWGRQVNEARPADGLRFTPTRVGKTPCECGRSGRRSVHPHTRGEDASMRSRPKASFGSPPHAWGRQLLSSVE